LQLEVFLADPDVVHLAVRLRDRFIDHGLVCVVIAFADDGVLAIDTWLSCRVLGRPLENTCWSASDGRHASAAVRQSSVRTFQHRRTAWSRRSMQISVSQRSITRSRAAYGRWPSMTMPPTNPFIELVGLKELEYDS
jgi:hypothetical protein